MYEASKNGAFAEDFGLRDQIRRASVSIMANIAEGHERSGTAEFVQFLSMAKGSAGEVKSHLCVALDLGYLNKPTFDRLSPQLLKPQLLTRDSSSKRKTRNSKLLVWYPLPYHRRLTADHRFSLMDKTPSATFDQALLDETTQRQLRESVSTDEASSFPTPIHYIANQDPSLSEIVAQIVLPRP